MSAFAAFCFFFFQAEDGIRDVAVTGVQTCALPIWEMLSLLEGDVPDELDAGYSDATLVAAARLIRRFHDATAGSPLAERCEVVCHGDLSPCNAVFRGGVPVALIDFDNATPGKRSDDAGYGC